MLRVRSDIQSVTGIYMHLLNFKYLKLEEKSFERVINRQLICWFDNIDNINNVSYIATKSKTRSHEDLYAIERE